MPQKKTNGTLIGMYTPYGYEIWYSGKLDYKELKELDKDILPESKDSNGFYLLYEAGNNPYDSSPTQSLSAEDGIGLRKIRSYCITTLKGMSKTFNTDYRVERDYDQEQARRDAV